MASLLRFNASVLYCLVWQQQPASQIAGLDISVVCRVSRSTAAPRVLWVSDGLFDRSTRPSALVPGTLIPQLRSVQGGSRELLRAAPRARHARAFRTQMQLHVFCF